jgi:hypothetical protein
LNGTDICPNVRFYFLPEYLPRQIARELRGKTMLAQEMVDKLEAPLWMYDRSWIGRKPRDLIKDAIASTNFPMKMKQLQSKERLYQLSSSHLMRESMKNPETTRFSQRSVLWIELLCVC